MSGPGLFAHQFRSDLARFWRNPQSRYFTLLLPIVFLVIFAGIFKGTTIVEGRVISITTFYVPGIMTLGIISASFVNLTQAVVTQRESGELKRLRGTPLPTSFVITSRAAVGVVVAIVMSALLLLIGRVAYNVPIPHSTMLGLVIAVIVGAAVLRLHGVCGLHAYQHGGRSGARNQPRRAAVVLHLRCIRARTPDPQVPA